MRLLDVTPCGVLSAFVECYWYVEASAKETSVVPDAILPNGTCNLILNLSEFPHLEYNEGCCGPAQQLRTRWYSGIRDRAIVVGPTRLTRVIGIRFKPGGIVPFTSVPSSEIARLTVEPDDVFGKDCQRLHDALLEQVCVNRQFEMLEDWLLTRFDPTAGCGGIVESLRLLDATSGGIPVSRLAAVAGLSPRHFRRRFEQAVGLTPKRLARILRFRKLIGAIGPVAGTVDWAGAALACGYFDQAHLIADFRDFAGVSPGEYVRRAPVVPGFMPEPQMAVFSNTDAEDPARMVTQ